MFNQNKNIQSGFSLIETLVSIFLLAIAVLGAAGMQITALKTAQQISFQAEAMQLATDIATTLHMQAEALQSLPANPYLDVDFKAEGEPKLAGVSCYGGAANCDAFSLSHFDIYEIEKRVKATLPQGRLKICKDASPWSDKLNRYVWECDSAGGAAPVVVKLSWQNKAGSHISAAGVELYPQVVVISPAAI